MSLSSFYHTVTYILKLDMISFCEFYQQHQDAEKKTCEKFRKYVF